MFFFNSSLNWEGMGSLETINFNNLDTSLTTKMGSMFDFCFNLVELDLSNFDTSNVTNMEYMFNFCSSLTTEITIMNSNTNDYLGMFEYAATAEDAKITVDYTSENSTLVDEMIDYISSDSNVVKGSQIY